MYIESISVSQGFLFILVRFFTARLGDALCSYSHMKGGCFTRSVTLIKPVGSLLNSQRNTNKKIISYLVEKQF